MSELDEKRIFAENLKGIMKEKGIEQKTLAQVIGVSDASVSFWLSGQKYPTPGKVQKIADFLGVRKSQLIDLTPKVNYKVELIARKLELLNEGQLQAVEQVIDTFLKERR